MEPNEVRNEVHADQVNAPVMQFRDLHGDIHLHAREDTPLRRAARELAAAVRRQWTAETEKRALRQPAPLRVRFIGLRRLVDRARQIDHQRTRQRLRDRARPAQRGGHRRPVLSETARHRSDTVTDPDGRALLRNDRRLCLTWLVLGAALYVLLLATIHLHWPPLVAAELVLIIGCAGAAGRTAWVSYLVAKLWLASRRRLPWRLMTFLDDARHRGVLRANGAAYQFRHVRLQEHLAAG